MTMPVPIGEAEVVLAVTYRGVTYGFTLVGDGIQQPLVDIAIDTEVVEQFSETLNTLLAPGRRWADIRIAGRVVEASRRPA
jgi:hypothetical protein